jgi:MoaA/NifB/PqqE/SkfB family radical SAM enzyme
MIKFQNLKQIHLEISNRCQAQCPMCDRNIRGGVSNPLISGSQWNLNDFKRIITTEVIEQVQQIYFCGNFGDPCVNQDLPSMLNYAKKVKKEIHLHVHTNGSMRKPEWWADIAKHFNSPNSYIVFSIDGLEDTHHLYRIGTKYEQVIENAKAFIKAGGNAHWAFLRFKHNEHQVEEAQRRASELGFTKFALKDTNRFHGDRKYAVWDENKNVTHYLEPASSSTMKFIPKEMLNINSVKKFVSEVEIDCQVKKYEEIYIDAYGHLYPCCFLAHSLYSVSDPGNINLDNLKPIVKNQMDNLIKQLGGIDAINTHKKPIKEIIESLPYQTVWKKLWEDGSLWICSKTCGKTKLLSKSKEQFTDYSSLS